MANQVAGRFRLVAVNGQPPEAGKPPYPRTFLKKDAFAEGYGAYGEGLEQWENPYRRIDPRHNEWSSGWAQHNFDLAN